MPTKRPAARSATAPATAVRAAADLPPSGEGRRRAVVEGIAPQVDGGRFAVKRVLSDEVVVEADAFADGHDVVVAELLHRHERDRGWQIVEMTSLGNDRWRASFRVEKLGHYRFAVQAWADRFRSWRRDFEKRVDAGQDVSVDLLVGAELVRDAAARARDVSTQDDADLLDGWAEELRGEGTTGARAALALDDELAGLMHRHPDRRDATRSDRDYEVVVDPIRAGFSAWYELFPRSWSPRAGRHGTLRDVIGALDYVAGMGFDVLYLPPIHPIGRQFRKGPNNSLTPGRRDPGVPWAIGGPEGGHDAVHPDLGTLDDLRALVHAARERGIEVALDLAFQASPDHPFVRHHPDWFRARPDGTIQYAENPPKKYQDIYPFDFESADWPALWTSLREVVRHWIDHGIRIFRVDNPHTKPFPFWEWLIATVKAEHPETLFLAEAFTRPKVMYRLGKIGFSQSYTYFTWRNTKAELTEYFTELSRVPVRDFYRPNAWPNTPDILHETLQHGGRAAFQARLVLAATLSANYGIYGPAFELMEHAPRELGSEEYLDSEKYEIRRWNLERPDSLAPLISLVNRARREHPALHANGSLRFHEIDHDQLIGYSKRTPTDRAPDDVILTVVNLDPNHAHEGTIELPLWEFGIDGTKPFEVHDLLTDATYLWQGPRNFVYLDPAVMPAHVFHVRPRVRTEEQFETYQ